VGSIAFSRSGDLSSGTFEDAQVLKRFGDAPTGRASKLAICGKVPSFEWPPIR
jgi:hypothetical protein